MLIARETTGGNYFCYFNFLNCSSPSNTGVILQCENISHTEINTWAFQEVLFAVAMGTGNERLFVLNCWFWFAAEDMEKYFIAVRVEFREVHFEIEEGSLNAFAIPIKDAECRLLLCRRSLAIPQEIMGDVVIAAIASVVIAVAWQKDLLLPKPDET
jgi:hypothetical protein